MKVGGITTPLVLGEGSLTTRYRRYFTASPLQILGLLIYGLCRTPVGTGVRECRFTLSRLSVTLESTSRCFTVTRGLALMHRGW